MQITKITKKVFVITDKYSTYVKTPYGKLVVEGDHQEGIKAANDYIAKR